MTIVIKIEYYLLKTRYMARREGRVLQRRG